jgi:hypothetical protein
MPHGLIGVIGAVRRTRQVLATDQAPRANRRERTPKLSANLSKPTDLPRRESAVLDGTCQKMLIQFAVS